MVTSETPVITCLHGGAMSDMSPTSALPGPLVPADGDFPALARRVPQQAGAEHRAGCGAPPSDGDGRAAVAAVGWRFVVEYAAAYTGVIIMLIAPLVVTLALKLDALVGDEAPTSLAVVAGLGSLVALVGNPLFGRLSDPDRVTARDAPTMGAHRPGRRHGRHRHRRPCPNVPVVVLGWCLAQLFLNAVLAALLAVLPDQVPSRQRGLVSGVLGGCLPVASVFGTLLVKTFSPHALAMFLAPCLVGGAAILWFTTRRSTCSTTSTAPSTTCPTRCSSPPCCSQPWSSPPPSSAARCPTAPGAARCS